MRIGGHSASRPSLARSSPLRIRSFYVYASCALCTLTVGKREQEMLCAVDATHISRDRGSCFGLARENTTCCVQSMPPIDPEIEGAVSSRRGCAAAPQEPAKKRKPFKKKKNYCVPLDHRVNPNLTRHLSRDGGCCFLLIRLCCRSAGT